MVAYCYQSESLLLMCTSHKDVFHIEKYFIYICMIRLGLWMGEGGGGQCHVLDL